MLTTENNSSPSVESQVRLSFESMLKNQPKERYATTLLAAWIDTPVGTMLSVADDEFLRLLSFMELAIMERKADIVQQQLGAALTMGMNPVLQSIHDEVTAYFDGVLREFTTPLKLDGTSFQLSVWDELQRVPFGMTVTYAELAKRIGKPAAFRAVAQANAQNPMAIVIPCHRVVNSDGRVGGIAAGLDRKKWLIDFEQGIVEEED